MGDAALEARARHLAAEWLGWDPNPATRAEIEGMVAAANWTELLSRLGSRISFGTAGLRGPMQAGYACMNSLTVIQASQGLCVYLEQVFGPAVVQERGVVIGYDGRHNSLLFARLAAAAFLSRGVRVQLFSEVVPTPFVPFAVLERRCVAGVMVTASHNPKQDNGYKVYWDNGSQIVAPHDDGITRGILANLAPWPQAPEALADRSPLRTDPTYEVAAAYYRAIARTLCHRAAANQRPPFAPVVHTAMHGVGTKWARLAFEAFGLPPFVPVAEQAAPDPEFPTVKFPNPEEGKGALALAMRTAEAAGAAFILANDPDADRLAIAERQAGGAWKLFSGNETGILLADWVWRAFRAAQPQVPPAECAMLNSTVSSKMLAAMAAREGFHYEETLTGFKWMGNKADELARGRPARRVLFAFEEAIGFMVGDLCRDKDGIRAAAVAAELYADLQRQQPPRTMQQQLEGLYERYGYFESRNRYFFCYDPAVLKRIFAEIRAGGRYAARCGEFEIVGVRDLTSPGFDSRPAALRAHSPALPVSSSTEMVTFYFANGGTATLRGSGTEPKLKYYVELSGQSHDRARISAELGRLAEAVIQQFLQPGKFGLVPPTD